MVTNILIILNIEPAEHECKDAHKTKLEAKMAMEVQPRFEQDIGTL